MNVFYMPAPDPQAGVVERGKWLFRQQGCSLCHGPEGRGGVPNRNYLKDTIPLLAVAEWMKLEPEDVTVDAIIAYLLSLSPAVKK